MDEIQSRVHLSESGIDRVTPSSKLKTPSSPSSKAKEDPHTERGHLSSDPNDEIPARVQGSGKGKKGVTTLSSHQVSSSQQISLLEGDERLESQPILTTSLPSKRKIQSQAEEQIQQV